MFVTCTSLIGRIKNNFPRTRLNMQARAVVPATLCPWATPVQASSTPLARPSLSRSCIQYWSKAFLRFRNPLRTSSSIFRFRINSCKFLRCQCCTIRMLS